MSSANIQQIFMETAKENRSRAQKNCEEMENQLMNNYKINKQKITNSHR